MSQTARSVPSAAGFPSGQSLGSGRPGFDEAHLSVFAKFNRSSNILRSFILATSPGSTAGRQAQQQEQELGGAAVRQMGVQRHQCRHDHEGDDAGEPQTTAPSPARLARASPRRIPHQTNHTNASRNGSPPLHRSHM